MTALSAAIGERGPTQSEAAEIFGVTQSRIPDLVRGRVKLFSRGTLIDMAATVGMACDTLLPHGIVKPELSRTNCNVWAAGKRSLWLKDMPTLPRKGCNWRQIG